MRRFILPVLGFMLVLSLTQCGNKAENKIVGVWQLEDMVVNGTILQGNALGNWLWEFNRDGGYLTDIAGIREKGVYTLKDGKLALKITSEKKKLDQVYTVARLDSVELDLHSIDTANNQTLRFMRRKAEDVAVDKD
jgi:hypothetical protein